VTFRSKICVKYLGVLTDSRSDWSSVQLVRTKLSRASYLLLKIRKFVPIAIPKILCRSFVYCHLHYNTVLCHGVQQTIPSCSHGTFYTI